MAFAGLPASYYSKYPESNSGFANRKVESKLLTLPQPSEHHTLATDSSRDYSRHNMPLPPPVSAEKSVAFGSAVTASRYRDSYNKLNNFSAPRDGRLNFAAGGSGASDNYATASRTPQSTLNATRQTAGILSSSSRSSTTATSRDSAAAKISNGNYSSAGVPLRSALSRQKSVGLSDDFADRLNKPVGSSEYDKNSALDPRAWRESPPYFADPNGVNDRQRYRADSNDDDENDNRGGSKRRSQSVHTTPGRPKMPQSFATDIKSAAVSHARQHNAASMRRNCDGIVNDSDASAQHNSTLIADDLEEIRQQLIKHEKQIVRLRRKCRDYQKAAEVANQKYEAERDRRVEFETHSREVFARYDSRLDAILELIERGGLVQDDNMKLLYNYVDSIRQLSELSLQRSMQTNKNSSLPVPNDQISNGVSIDDQQIPSQRGANGGSGDFQQQQQHAQQSEPGFSSRFPRTPSASSTISPTNMHAFALAARATSTPMNKNDASHRNVAGVGSNRSVVPPPPVVFQVPSDTDDDKSIIFVDEIRKQGVHVQSRLSTNNSNTMTPRNVAAGDPRNRIENISKQIQTPNTQLPVSGGQSAISAAIQRAAALSAVKLGTNAVAVSNSNKASESDNSFGQAVPLGKPVVYGDPSSSGTLPKKPWM